MLLVSQPVGLVLALAFALLAGGDPLTTGDAAIAAGAGAHGRARPRRLLPGDGPRARSASWRRSARSGSWFRSIGGLAQGEDPAAIQSAGAVAAIVGVVLVAREPDPEWRAAGRASIGLAALAALGFGTFFLGLDAAAGDEPAWTVVVARVGGVATLLVAAAAMRPSMAIPSELWPALLAIGFCDVLANSLFAVATNHGLLALVGVVGSLYSAVTVLLARVFLKERLRGAQRAGIVVALAGVVLIAAGS